MGVCMPDLKSKMIQESKNAREMSRRLTDKEALTTLLLKKKERKKKELARGHGMNGAACRGKKYRRAILVAPIGAKECIQGNQRAAIVDFKVAMMEIVKLAAHVGVKAMVTWKR